MYLKQLVLKGFKSFADRSVLTLEPGVTAVVGPNGSGKSNISDAVLWVLGERNAKNLRGQVMEDVIFAGSSARKSVGVAEVSLVLDNSDGALPIDYNEVTISRRMYRNGESEYLINGSIVRRLDVLDILHDSGLGTGTHSIISQGHLDSILQSKPEDRRALIEEAAGVLKHKQRKEKSQRKIAQMDQHLARVHDVTNEIERQLGPLQRKARRAVQYKEISAELDRVRLDLAVDDLRSLQSEWDKLLTTEKVQADQYESARHDVQQLEESFDQIQERIRQESADVSGLSQKHARAQAVTERFDSLSLLLNEKRRVAIQRCAELNQQLEDNQAKRAQAQADRQTASTDLESARQARSNAQQAVDAAQFDFDQAHSQRIQLEQELSVHQRRRGDAEREIERKRRELTSTQSQLASSLGKVQAAEERLRDIDSRIEKACVARDESTQTLALAQAEVAQLEIAEATASEYMITSRQTRDDLSQDVQKALSEVRAIEAELSGIREVERALLAASGPAHSWVAQQTNGNWGTLHPLYGSLTVEQGYEALVERVLGQDVTALIVEDTQRVSAIDSDLKKAGKAGNVTLLSRISSRHTNKIQGFEYLVDKVSCEPELNLDIDALLGDVIICNTVQDAIAASATLNGSARFIARDGSLVWPSGKIQLGSASGCTAENGATLSRSRRLKELESQSLDAASRHASAQKALDAATETAKKAQEESLRIRQELAVARGKVTSAQREADERLRHLTQVQQERTSSLAVQQQAIDAVDAAQPKVDQINESIEQLDSLIESSKQLAGEVRHKLHPLRDQEQTLSAKLSDAKIALATLTERETFAAKTVDERSRELLRLSSDDDQAFATLSSQQAVRKRVDPLLEVVIALCDLARVRVNELAGAIEDAHAANTGSHEQATQAREKVRIAQVKLEQINQTVNDLRVEKGRLELRVQAAVDYIVSDCGSTMEQALALPKLEDRAAAEEQSFKLQRRIANLGTINPDAAQEYEELKVRYDYLKAQLDDLASARLALKRIDKVIDDRMRDDFVNTFNTVNGYFKEIFAELFPGGSAELTLVDPNDLENTGVEVTAQPRGKRITKMTLMSGGEKSLVACALLFAVYRTRTTPFYILDEIEAALDDSNLRRLIAYLADLSTRTQLIMITHQRRTMEMADVLFGVSMQADGVTKVISQRLDKALQYAE